MNTQLNELTERISNAWEHLRATARTEDFPASQQAFRSLAELHDLKNQLHALEDRFARMSDRDRIVPTAPISPGPIPTPSTQAPQITSPRTSFARRARRPAQRPAAVRIGPHHEAINYAYEIVIVAAEWCLRQGIKLPPIPNFVHATNSGFSASATPKELSDGSWIEIGDSQPTLLHKARTLLDACGFSNERIEVTMRDGTCKTV